MIVDVVGFRASKFTANDGSLIEGYTLYITYGENRVIGVVADRVFVSLNKCGGYVPQLGDVIDLEYNRYGKINRVSPANI